MLTEAVRRLRSAGCIAAEAEAAELLADDPCVDVLDERLRRREDGEPLAWIVGSTAFCGRRVIVHPGVYVPRPQTEELARRAAALLPSTGVAIDLCTGSGAVAAHLGGTRPLASVVGVDLDGAAVACARANGVAAIRADVRALPLRGPVDLVTAVAPYVPTSALALLPSDVRRHEPPGALDGGPDGLRIVRPVLTAAAGLLRPGGHLLLEVGGAQAERLAVGSFDGGEPWHDEDGDLRGLLLRRR